MPVGAVLDLPFPPGCAACGGPGWPWCRRCEAAVGVLVPPWCERCGRPFLEALGRCRDCPPRPVSRARAPFAFDGPVRDAMLRLKFGGRAALAGPLARAMAATWRTTLDAANRGRAGERDRDGPPAAVTWVPLSARRRAERGFDQAEALAREAGALLALPVRRLLARDVDTPPQARSGRAERRRALRGAFRATGPTVGGVLLVDDVLTTGSTAAECARVLLRAGARRVDVLTAARTLSGPLPPRCYNPDILPSGSVVARGSSPKVDASRRRNDPRKATLGR